MSPTQTQRTKLRLVVGRLFTDRLRHDQAWRENFMERTGWDMKSPVVPTEFDCLFGDVYATAKAALSKSVTGVAAIPVVMLDRDSKTIEIAILTMRRGGKPSDDNDLTSIDIDSVSHEITMGQVCQTLTPNKRWDLSLLAEDADRLRTAGKAMA